MGWGNILEAQYLSDVNQAVLCMGQFSSILLPEATRSDDQDAP